MDTSQAFSDLPDADSIMEQQENLLPLGLGQPCVLFHAPHYVLQGGAIAIGTQASLVRANAQSMPNAMAVDSMELPPYDTNGSVIPVMGISPMFMPTFINIWESSIAKRPNE